MSVDHSFTVQIRPRAHPLALLAGGLVAGFGLASLALALLLPAPQAAPLAPAPSGQAQQDPQAQVPEPWPAAFGVEPAPETPAAEPQVEAPAPEDEEDDYQPYDYSDYSLRGMVTQPEGGWALVESTQGVEVVRVGSQLSGGERVVEITPDGVVLQGFGPAYLLSFSDDDIFEDVEPTDADDPEPDMRAGDDSRWRDGP
ncbi:MAG: Type IV pilus biogenesis [Rhodobacteraceae bacterium HLUCCA12]|nr:MAG: Type IV pilus biogenesis [Rhodobacteraceae bacterium HLUCCA12]